MMYNTRNAISSVKKALNNIQKDYSGKPLYFINERDIQCRVYAELFEVFNKPKKVQVNQLKNKKGIKTANNQRTIPLHAELYQDHRNVKIYRKWKGRFVDLGIILDNKSLSVTAKHKGKKKDSNSFYGKPKWDPRHTIGIEIKFNDWCFKETKDKKNTKWRSFEEMVREDLLKLNDYKRGVFIMVDREGIFSKSEWCEFIHELIPKSSRKRRIQTITAYYLSPTKHPKVFAY